MTRHIWRCARRWAFSKPSWSRCGGSYWAAGEPSIGALLAPAAELLSGAAVPESTILGLLTRGVDMTDYPVYPLVPSLSNPFGVRFYAWWSSGDKGDFSTLSNRSERWYQRDSVNGGAKLQSTGRAPDGERKTATGACVNIMCTRDCMDDSLAAGFPRHSRFVFSTAFFLLFFSLLHSNISRWSRQVTVFVSSQFINWSKEEKRNRSLLYIDVNDAARDIVQERQPLDEFSKRGISSSSSTSKLALQVWSIWMHSILTDIHPLPIKVVFLNQSCCFSCASYVWLRCSGIQPCLYSSVSSSGAHCGTRSQENRWSSVHFVVYNYHSGSSMVGERDSLSHDATPVIGSHVAATNLRVETAQENSRFQSHGFPSFPSLCEPTKTSVHRNL